MASSPLPGAAAGQHELLVPACSFLAPQARLPWASWAEWCKVMDGLWNGRVGNLQWAMSKLREWQSRHRVPVCVAATTALMQHAIDDRPSSTTHGPQQEEMLRMTGSMAVVRLVNGLVDVSAGRSAFRSVAVVAERLGLPRSAVDLRHESTHQVLPTLPAIRVVRDDLLVWLQHRYWHAQYDALAAEIERAHKAILNPLEAAAAEYASAAAAEHERSVDIDSDGTGSTDTAGATSQSPCCITFREPKRGDVLCGAIHAPASNSKKRRTKRHHDDPEGSPMPSPSASVNSPFVSNAAQSQPVPPSLAVCSLRAPAVGIPKGHAALAAHIALLSAIPGTPEHKSLFAAEAAAGRARAVAGSGDLEGLFDAMGHFLGKGRGSKKRQRAMEAASASRQSPGTHDPHALTALLCPLTSSPSLLLGAVLVPLLLDGRASSPADLGTPGTSPGPHVHEDGLYTAAVMDLQGRGRDPPQMPLLPQHPPPSAAPLLPLAHSPVDEAAYSAGSMATTECIFHATREAWTPCLFDLQGRLPNFVPTLVVGLLHRLTHEGAACGTFPASARQHMLWLWLRFFLSRRWHGLFHHELALRPARPPPGSASLALPGLASVFAEQHTPGGAAAAGADTAPWGVPITGSSSGGGGSAWQQLLLLPEWTPVQQAWMDSACPLRYCTASPRIQDAIAMRVACAAGSAGGELEKEMEDFEPPYIPLGGVLPLASLTHSVASEGVASPAAKPALALIAGLGVEAARSVLRGDHPWWDPPLHAPLPGLQPAPPTKQAAVGARQVAFAAEVRVAADPRSPLAASPIAQDGRQTAAAAAAAPVTPLRATPGASASSGEHGQRSVCAAVTPAFDETAVLSLDDIENMLGMSGSADGGHANSAGGGAQAAAMAGGKSVSIARGTAPPAARGKGGSGSIFGAGGALDDTVSDAAGGTGAHGRGGGTSQMLSFDDEGCDRGDHVRGRPEWHMCGADTVLPEGFALGRVIGRAGDHSAQ